MPVIFVISVVITNYTNEIYGGLAGCPKIMENYDNNSTILRDFGYVFFITMGIYSQKSTLVSRFITHERSQLQQRQLAKVFHEQPDGLIVLKQRFQDSDSGSNLTSSKKPDGGAGAEGATETYSNIHQATPQ